MVETRCCNCPGGYNLAQIKYLNGTGVSEVTLQQQSIIENYILPMLCVEYNCQVYGCKALKTPAVVARHARKKYDKNF